MKKFYINDYNTNTKKKVFTKDNKYLKLFKVFINIYIQYLHRNLYS